MDTTPVSSTTTPAQKTNATPNTRGVLSSDFEVFLKMLTAQARYQDPLDPIDNSEYAAQLAQFSMVEQQVQTNELMERLIKSNTGSDSDHMAKWIGKEALTAEPASFDGSPIQVIPTIPKEASASFMVVKDASGKVVDRVELNKDATSFTWAGTDESGFVRPSGLYTFDVEAVSGVNILSTNRAWTFGRVVESRLENGQPVLLLASGGKVAPSDIKGLREPQS